MSESNDTRDRGVSLAKVRVFRITAIALSFAALSLYQNCSGNYKTLSLDSASSQTGAVGVPAPNVVGQTKTPPIGVYSWDKADRTDLYSAWLERPLMMGQSHQGKDGWARVEGEGWALAPWSRWVNAAPNRVLNLSVVMIPAISGVSLSQCAAGAYDAHYTALAVNLVKYKLHNSILRLGWEFDGDWMPWSSIGQPQNYAACFRRMVNAMRKVEGTQLKFDWNPNGDIQAAEMLPAYPGDDFVDFVGTDLYDVSWASGTFPYPANCDDACRLDRQQKAWASFQAPGLATILTFARAHHKPISIPEWGLIGNGPNLPGGGDNPYYIRKMLEFIFDPANNVAYSSYFDVNTSENNIQLSTLNSGGSPNVTKAPVASALFLQIMREHLAVDGSIKP